MKKYLFLILTAPLFISFGYCQNVASSVDFNCTSFTNQQSKITPELESLTSSEFKSYPEYGVLPFNAPCKDCFELLQKRDESHRYFVKEGSNGKQFYSQSSYGNLSFRDENGMLRTIDPRLKPGDKAGVFKAKSQPFPITLNLPGKSTSILNAGKELQVNRDVTIYIKHKDGSVSSLGQASWSDYTAGDNGVVVHNFYNGIDLLLEAGEGKIESSYRLNKPLPLGDGWLVIRDNIKLPEGLTYDYSYSEKKEGNFYQGSLCLNDHSGTRYFVINTPTACDINGRKDDRIALQYQTDNSGHYDLYIPTDWMNDSQRSYPLVIDPIVNATSTFPKASITGSGYNATCFTGGCSYNLPVVVPPACVVTGMTYSFNYRALQPCALNQGAWDLSYAGCKGVLNTCNIGLPGLCILQNLDCFNNFHACIPAPQCPTYNMDFTLTFYRCVQPGAGCGFSCINADTDWDMTVEGRTVEVATSDATVCEGSSVNLTANAIWGVPPYTYTWNPGGLNGQTVNVSPVVNTVYTVTVTTCGGTDQAQKNSNVTVVPNDNPGFTINPNPVCLNTPMTISGLGAGLPSYYSWTLADYNPPTVNNQQTFPITYTTTGVHDIILHYTSGSCTFDKTLQATVFPVPTADFTFNPSDPSEFTLTVSFVDKSVGATTWSWNFGDQSPNENTQNPVHAFPGVGTYTISLTVTNADSCTSTVSYSLTVHPEYLLYMPNAFTPNEDGKNDYFTPQGTHVIPYEMSIYDRWGNEVFKTSNNSVPWGGQIAGTGKVAPADVYVYKVKYQDSSSTSKEIVGTVTLVR